MGQEYNFEWSLYYNYEYFKEKSLTNRFFKHSDIKKLINNIQFQKLFKIDTVGNSFEGREIFLITVGRGAKKILFWSQMHGDEPTATAALFDIFNFFSDSLHFTELKRYILEKTTLYFIPMLNPDGAENFSRRNAMQIDINRDANRLETPEGKILMNVFDRIKPDFGFNLHDQSHRYSVGNSFRQATISFLAPPIDDEKNIDSVRLNAIKLISGLYEMLSEFIPGHVSRYSDEYEPRAFGDTFQKKGTSTILVESGGWKSDHEKQFIRKLNFILLLSAIKNISTEDYKSLNEKIYDSIPFNEERLYDLILRNLTVSNGEFEYKIDLAINYNEIYDNDKNNYYYIKATIENIGDLSTYYGIEDYDFNGYKIEPGKNYVNNKKTLKKDSKYFELMKKGFTNIFMPNFKGEISSLPFNIIKNKRINFPISVGSNPTFILKRGERIEYLVINGFIQNLISKTFYNKGIVFEDSE
ncbi:MAG: M14 family zinc carboxypeptidase [Ignavibacterium sp.]|nr:M14 family zinc carboxypeptidase [Ignavibacterium sp.]